ncbi:hypothetical protein HAX54_049935, partial [Datura stramonium]|nr:hypothetical protein [Datura stramonium]
CWEVEDANNIDLLSRVVHLQWWNPYYDETTIVVKLPLQDGPISTGLITTAAEIISHVVLELTIEGELWEILSCHLGCPGHWGEGLQYLLDPLPHMEKSFSQESYMGL